MGIAIAHIREQRGMSRDSFAAKIEEEPAVVEKIERGEVNADWATLRVVAYALDLPLDALMELAQEHAPGAGGDEWRKRSRESEQKREARERGGDEDEAG